jgi:hypothetical protein
VQREDFIERMIRQLAEALARIAGRTANGKLEEALAESDRAWTDLLDVPRDLIERLDGPTLAQLLADPMKMRIAGELLAAEARVHQAKGNPVHALLCNKRAFELFLEARALDPEPRDEAAILELARLIPKTEIDPRYRAD